MVLDYFALGVCHSQTVVTVSGSEAPAARVSPSPIMAELATDSPQHNFLKQFRDENSRQFRKFTAMQFMDVWNHYDQDGMCQGGYEIHGVCQGFNVINGTDSVSGLT